MGQNNKKYLDYAGLEKLVDLHAIVPHPQVTITDEGAYKIAFDEHGHIVSKSPLTASDLGLDKAMRFVGVSTTDPASTTGATVVGHTGSFVAGDVCIYKRSNETGYEEYVYTGTAWELLGDADSYALKSIKVEGDGTYVTGGGDLSQNRKLSHKSYTTAAPAVRAIGRDSGGHVDLGGNIIVQNGGGFTHTHDASTTIGKDTYVIDVTPSKKKLSITPTTKSVIESLSETQVNLDITTITPVSGSVKASKATASTAKNVAKAGDAVVYGKANVGDTVTGLAKRASEQTTVGNANIATSPTLIGNANVGSAITYGTANVDTEITVQDGKADVGTAVVYGKANVGDKVSVAQQATAQTLVGNADVGEAVVYGTADVDAQITVYAGKADVGTAVTYGTADVGGKVSVATMATSPSTFLTSVSAAAPTTTVSPNKTVYNASVSGETLVFDAVTFSATTTAPTLTPSTGSIYGVANAIDITPAVASTKTLTPAKESNRTVSFTPAKAADTTRKLTPAKAVSTTSTKIYGVSGSVDITPAVAAPSTQTLTPAVASNRTKSFTPAIESTKTLTPAVKSTSTIYGAVASDTKIYGVTSDQVSVTSATNAPATQTIIPAVANGTITPYTFADVDVPVAASSVQVATGTSSIGGGGVAVMTGITTSTLEVMTDATVAKGTNGDVEVMDGITVTKNSATTFDTTVEDYTYTGHIHGLAEDK